MGVDIVSNRCKDNNKNFKAGFVALVGKPNVGKSSIINAILQEKALAVSQKPQTTRNAIRCIYTTDNEQIVFVDTPGIHTAKHDLGKYMRQEAIETLNQADLVCLVVEAGSYAVSNREENIIELLVPINVPKILIVNKVDILHDINFYKKTAKLYNAKIVFSEIIPFSAKEGYNLEGLVTKISSYLPAQPIIYEKDMLMDTTERFLAAEIIREKILQYTQDEVPHSVAVLVDEFKSPIEYPERKTAKIRATIIVDRDGQKGIIIGKKGSMLKDIGSAARIDLEKKFAYPVYLDLWVKVKPGWRQSIDELRRLGYVF